jgi:dihydroorotase
VIHAQGCYVTPGFIDYHVHYFNRGSDNGVNADVASFPCGVTTAVDGGTCGVSSYELFEKSIINQTDIRLLSLLHVASGGQLTDDYPKNLKPDKFNIPRIKQLFEKYRLSSGRTENANF